MQASVRVWLELSHHQAFRIGGWAFVRFDADGVSGFAGGERQVDGERICLAGIAAALRDLASGASVVLLTASPEVLAVPRRIAAAEAGKTPLADNLDLWAPVSTALRRIAVAVRRVEPAPGSVSAFAAAWSDFARDRAKDKGAFRAAIPKSNLAKARALTPGPEAGWDP
jgi:ribonuclease HI